MEHVELPCQTSWIQQNFRQYYYWDFWTLGSLPAPISWFRYVYPNIGVKTNISYIWMLVAATLKIIMIIVILNQYVANQICMKFSNDTYESYFNSCMTYVLECKYELIYLICEVYIEWFLIQLLMFFLQGFSKLCLLIQKIDFDDNKILSIHVIHYVL